MQSNRLIVVLNSEMEMQFQSGISTVYKNSHLVNDFIVRPTFLLQPTETMYVTFQNAVKEPSVKLKPILLAEREASVANSTQQLVKTENDTTISQIAQSNEKAVEYYLPLPDAVLQNEGQWFFSLEVREIPNVGTPDVFSVIATSGVESFTVNNSLSNANEDGSTPTDLDVAALFATAKENVKQAAESADSAEQFAKDAANYAPYIGEDENWHEFDRTLGKYVNTGVSARGAKGDKGDTGEQGAKGDTGANALVYKGIPHWMGYTSEIEESLPIADFNRTPVVGDVFIVEYYNTEDNCVYLGQCVVNTVNGYNVIVQGIYFEKVSSEPPEVVQATGTSETAVMSQKAVTDAIASSITTVLNTAV